MAPQQQAEDKQKPTHSTLPHTRTCTHMPTSSYSAPTHHIQYSCSSPFGSSPSPHAQAPLLLHSHASTQPQRPLCSSLPSPLLHHTPLQDTPTHPTPTPRLLAHLAAPSAHACLSLDHPHPSNPQPMAAAPSCGSPLRMRSSSPLETPAAPPPAAAPSRCSPLRMRSSSPLKTPAAPPPAAAPSCCPPCACAPARA